MISSKNRSRNKTRLRSRSRKSKLSKTRRSKLSKSKPRMSKRYQKKRNQKRIRTPRMSKNKRGGFFSGLWHVLGIDTLWENPRPEGLHELNALRP